MSTQTGLAAKEWKHWYCTFTIFLEAMPEHEPKLLTNYVAPSVYDYISDSKTYDEAIATLTSL